MDPTTAESYRDLYQKYRARIEEQLQQHQQNPTETRNYQEFKKEIVRPQLSWYEKACDASEKILNLKPKGKTLEELQDSIETAHLSVTPTGAYSFGFLAPICIMLLGSMVAFIILQSMMYVVLMLILGLVLVGPATKLPNYMATYWRLKASNQMVLCIFYVVTYMRHTSNLENAIQFASEHMSPPLALDMKKIVWDVETEKFNSVKDSLNDYLEGWRKYNMEFVEAFHLIQSSLLEGDETRRLAALDKSLDVILEETYEKMLHYAHNLKSPITMLHMLGVILPILGMVILPLLVSFMEGVNWLHIMFFYNIILPVGVYLWGRAILIKRPTGYGDTDISEENPNLKKYRRVNIKFLGSEMSLNPLHIAITVWFVLFMIGLSPIIIHAVDPNYDLPLDGDAQDAKFWLLKYVPDKTGVILGPFGLGATILSLSITLAFGLGIGLYYKLRSQNVIKIRDETKKLEEEFASALFQLGNRLGDDIPAEMAFGRVADYMGESNSGKFFRYVSINIQKLGMSVNQAIFDPRHGALLYFPSRLIESSMKVMIESVKKGPRVAAQALTNIARYIKEIHRVNERLKDLMAEIISSMNSQIKFMTPAISGIVVGISSMITMILIKLKFDLQNVTAGNADTSTLAGIDINLFGIGIPTYFLQIVVGLYVVEIIYILSIMSNGIENGSDKLNERYILGVNLVKGTVLYVLITLVITIMFNFIAANVMNGVT